MSATCRPLAGTFLHRFVAAALFALAATLAQAAPLSPRALQLEAFANTSAGREISRALLGAPVRTLSDLDQLAWKLRSNDPHIRSIREELELRMPQLARELERYSNLHATHAHLESLSARILRFDQTEAGLQFFPFFSELPSASFTRSAQNFLEAAPETRFEAAIPRGPRSIDRQLGVRNSIYARLMDLEKKYVHQLGVLDPDAIAHRLAVTRPRVTVRDVTDEILRLRREMLRELNDWAHFYDSAHPSLAKQLRKTRAELNMSSDATARYQIKARDFEQWEYVAGQHDDMIRGYNGKVQGELGELRVLVRVDDFSQRGLKIQDLVQNLGSSTPRSALSLWSRIHATPQFAGKELDLILDEGRTWAEVKTFRDIFSPQHRQFRHVIDQAELTIAIRDYLYQSSEWRRVYPEPILLKIYFLGGVTDDAARVLEQMGLEVIGARI
jgi:hypothetical protein